MKGAQADRPVTRRHAALLATRVLTKAVVWWGAWHGTTSWFFMPAAWSRPNPPHNHQQSKTHPMSSTMTPHDPYRLPRHVIPSQYDLRIEPNLQAYSFTGHEVVTLTVTEPTSEIILNATELEVSTATLSGEKTSPRTGTVRMDEEHQRCHISFPSVIQPGAWN